MPNTFVVGDDLFSFADSNWALTGRSVAAQLDNAVPKDGAGEFVPAAGKTHTPRTEVTCEYTAQVYTAALTVALSLGLADPVSGYVPTRIEVTPEQTGHCKIRITGHAHGLVAHEVNSIDVTVDVDGFGCTDFISSTQAAGCQSSSWSASIEHIDRYTRDAQALLCGRSQGCKVEANVTIVADTAPAAAAAWTVLSSEIKEGGDFYTASIRAEQHLAA